ncbi:MAG: hypothetical protein WC642_15685 [Nocardioides sp.]|jgi:hypothetical protein
MRRAELVALTLADVEHKPAGLLLNIRKSKTDQEGHGQTVAVAHGQHALTDPVAALAAWRDVRGATPGALFNAPATPPPQHWQACLSIGSRPRPATRTSPCS